MTRIAAIGECMLELSGGEKDAWRMGYAGDTFNTLWTMRALLPSVCETDYVSAFGDDPFSQRQIEFFRDQRIGIAESPIVAGARPGLYAITLDGAERSFTYWRSDSAARHLADDTTALDRSLESRDLIYFSGISLAILDEAGRERLLDAIGKARGSGIRIAFDPNYRARLWPATDAAREAIGAALEVTDIALPTLLDEIALFGDRDEDAALERIAAAGVGEIVVKNGPDAATSALSGSSVRRIAATRVAKAVDTTGAGDGFNGAYLAARLGGDAPAEAVRRAHNVAAAVIQVRGALAPSKRLRQAFML